MFLSFLFSKSRKAGRRSNKHKTHRKHGHRGGYSSKSVSRSNAKTYKSVKSK